METKILEHRIGYFFRGRDGLMLDGLNRAYVADMISQGYNQGELNQGEEEIRGWWHIIYS